MPELNSMAIDIMVAVILQIGNVANEIKNVLFSSILHEVLLQKFTHYSTFKAELNLNGTTQITIITLGIKTSEGYEFPVRRGGESCMRNFP